MTNFNRMTIRTTPSVCSVFKMKRAQVGGYATDMAQKRFTWVVSRIAKAQFTGSYSECLQYIQSQGAEFMTEHGIAC